MSSRRQRPDHAGGQPLPPGFPRFRERARRRGGARAGRWHRPHRHHLRPACENLAQVLAVAEKFPEIFCSVGTHPHNAHEELDIDAKSADRADADIPKSSRSARPDSIITTTSRRARRRLGLPPAHCRGARNRPAAGDPFARLRRRHGAHSGGRKREGRFPGRAALLHRRPRFGVRSHRVRPLRFVHRHSDVQEFAKSARRRARRCRPIAFWSRPMRHTSRRCHIVANATSRLMWRKPLKF